MFEVSQPRHNPFKTARSFFNVMRMKLAIIDQLADQRPQDPAEFVVLRFPLHEFTVLDGRFANDAIPGGESDLNIVPVNQ